MLAYPLAMWLLQVMGLFVVFTVQGAMWKGAQDENRNGWVIALLWAVAVATLYIPMHELLHQFPSSNEPAIRSNRYETTHQRRADMRLTAAVFSILLSV